MVLTPASFFFNINCLGRDIANYADQVTLKSTNRNTNTKNENDADGKAEEGGGARAREDAIQTTYNFSKYFAKTRRYIHEADYAVANLESPLVDAAKKEMVGAPQ